MDSVLRGKSRSLPILLQFPLLVCIFSALAAAQPVPAPPGGAAGAGQRPAAAPEEVAPEDRASIEGTVVNGRTDQPLKKALIQVVRTDARSGGNSIGVITDAAGKFSIKDLNPGSYSVRVSRNGFASPDMSGAQRSTGSAPGRVTLRARQEMKGLAYKLMPGAVITGRVVDDEGEPVANARIMCMRYQYVQGRRQLVPAGGMDGGGTDDTGAYRIFGLPAGRYTVAATYTDYRSMMTEIRNATNESYARVYYPGVLDATQAAALPIREGEERSGVDFKMVKTRSYRIRGRLTLESGNRLTFGYASLFPRTGGFFINSGQAQIKPDGGFEIRNVMPGQYLLIGSSFDAGEQVMYRAPVDVTNENIDNIEGVIRAGFEVKGQVKLEDGTPDQGLENINIILRPKEENMMMGGGFASVDKDGSFIMKRVNPGSFRVTVMGGGAGFGVGQLPYYLKSARFGDQDAADSLTVTDAGTRLDVVLSAAGGKVEGSVRDAEKKPAVGIQVALVPEGDGRSNPDLFKSANTDQDGRFSFTGLKPGEYKVFAWEKVESGAWQDPAFLEPIEAKGKKVKVEKGAAQTVDPEIIPADEK